MYIVAVELCLLSSAGAVLMLLLLEGTYESAVEKKQYECVLKKLICADQRSYVSADWDCNIGKAVEMFEFWPSAHTIYRYRTYVMNGIYGTARIISAYVEPTVWTEIGRHESKQIFEAE